MGRAPCCDKVEIKKGPWTPEEDITLVTHIQEHGPGNWRAVPTKTGLLRCSKSCRLRWTNYLRPGIKRGNFTQSEEAMIIHLQALLGNKWAAIASYLPQRTDNDIKNYWNTHLKKKLNKFHSGFDRKTSSESMRTYSTENGTKSNSGLMLSENSSVYASSSENISKLLEGWVKPSSPPILKDQNCDFGKFSDGFNDFSGSFLSFEKSSSERSELIDHETVRSGHGNKLEIDNIDSDNPTLSFLEKWFLDESAGQGEGAMEISQIF